MGKVKKFGREVLLPLAFKVAKDDHCVDPEIVLTGTDVVDPGVRSTSVRRRISRSSSAVEGRFFHHTS